MRTLLLIVAIFILFDIDVQVTHMRCAVAYKASACDNTGEPHGQDTP